ncbi:YolD-like family protein [Paenibacillus sp. FSL L8-0436]|uniref:YolD-like family protein n=1 Tax=Paenibacillus sp. FSL L8-0436 TaxID=2954686 RepID=UPI003158D42C
MKKLESIFDCSRMMTPEHKLRIISDEREQQWRDRKKPVLDAQELELIDQVLAYSKRYGEQITVTMFDPVQDIKVRGVVLAVDRQLRQIKLQMEYDYSWIKIDGVIQVIT